jgi:hypothetical protein
MRKLARKQSRPPIAEIRCEADFSWAAVLALMAWPKSVREQGHALATYAGDLLGAIEHAAPHVMRVGPERAASEFATVNGIRAEYLPFMPATAAHIDQVMTRPAETARAVVEQMFRPAGGFKGVADAPGTSAILKHFTRASREATAVGALLMLVALFDAAYPEIEPSLGKAHAAFLASQYRLPGFVQVDVRTLKRWWKEWRGISPIWAALVLHCKIAEIPDQAAAWEAIFDPDRRRQILGWAKWFREFAITFRSSGAQEPLVAMHEVVELYFDVELEKPPLSELALDSVSLNAAKSGHSGNYFSR